MASSLGSVTSEKASLARVAASSEQLKNLLNWCFGVIGSISEILTEPGKPTLKQDFTTKLTKWKARLLN